jgi:hypothetical protein
MLLVDGAVTIAWKVSAAPETAGYYLRLPGLANHEVDKRLDLTNIFSRSCRRNFNNNHVIGATRWAAAVAI